ncbi:MAG TPA: tetraacyldisaccharide 4'-kinase [Flavobacterium sp.]|jgi:tetraacyldisaccharide 4'-kinase
MNLLRKILFPFAAIYGGITWIRNYLYDHGIFRSEIFNVPIIAVGNISTGGTGKSPQIEYLIRLLSPNYKVATLSRGYKRKSSGFILADSHDTAETLGDEPYQFHLKFPEVRVAVDADRRNGIKKLLELPQKPDLILLDDAFQHRKVQAGMYILLTAYGDIYADDFVLPTGNLRESRRGAKRAQIIIVTKCPPDLSMEEQLKIQLRLKLKSAQQLFFSYIDYDDNVYSETNVLSVSDMRSKQKVLVAGIAKPQPFFDYLSNFSDVKMQFSDHHVFSDNEIAEIAEVSKGKLLVTTEKDYVRLKNTSLKDSLFYLPIKTKFIGGSSKFNKSISNYLSPHESENKG